jgi:GTPase
MIDLVKLHLQAGNGGNGRVSFRREKYIPKGGPSGGSGGDGGSIIIQGVNSLSSLHHLAGVKGYVAKPGQSGGNKKKTGVKADSIVIKVPVGTKVWLLAENEVSQTRRQRYSLDYKLNRDEVKIEKYYLTESGEAPPKYEIEEVRPILAKSEQLQEQYQSLMDAIDSPIDSLKDVDFKKLPKQQLVEITSAGQEVTICQGGYGGRGNDAFKGPAKTTPMEAEKGSVGEHKVVVLEQLLLADVGLVGFPNAGKSTLISVLTKARPKVGDYPFTTLEPHLGVLEANGKELVIADIPGLIEGASEGKGLGHAFLRHVEHCSLLLFVLFLTEEAVFNEELDVAKKAEQIYDQFVKLHRELGDYGQELINKPYLIGINKLDLYSDELIQAVKDIFAKNDQEVLLFSAATQESIGPLLETLVKKLI